MVFGPQNASGPQDDGFHVTGQVRVIIQSWSQ